MKDNINIVPLMKKMTANKNSIFLYMCLGVHLSYFIAFMLLGITPLAVINFGSVLFYLLIIAVLRIKSEKAIVASYFEIIVFSLISGIVTRGEYCFIAFVIGMVAVVFYMTPSYKNKRFIFQFIGIVAAVIISIVDDIVPKELFRSYYELIMEYKPKFVFTNILITLCTILYTSYFYEMELDMVRKELDYNCTHDTLTGLYNRRFLYDILKKGDNEEVVVAILDIDNFKKINDRFGHDIGDTILISVSDCLGTGDKAYFPVRWGGEEFVIYCTKTDVSNAYEHVSSVCSSISEQVILPDGSPVTVTAGLVDGTKNEFENAIKKADEYLYMGKQNGKNCIVWRENESRYI